MKDGPQQPLGMHELHDALQRLDEYAKLQSEDEDTSPHPLRRIANLARCFLTALVSDTVRDRDLLTEPTVIDAVEVVQRNYLLLEKMRRGSPDQIQLAETALEIIQRFNCKIREQEQSPALEKRFARFLRGRHATQTSQSAVIQAPLPAFWQDTGQSKVIDLGSHRLSIHEGTDKVTAMTRCPSSPLAIHCKPTQREMDAFRMKAVTMIRSLSYPATSVSETLRAVQNGIVHGRQLRSNVVTFSQAIEPFPGETLTLEGSFIRSGQKLSHSTPLPDSFHLSTKSLQSGFPFPEQYNGWALSDRLIPFMPQMLKDRPQLAQLLARKQALANQLLPRGATRTHAMRCLMLKKRVANTNKGEILALHEQLACALQGGGMLVRGEVTQKMFAWLRKRKEPWSDLCRIYRWVIEWFIHEPSDRLRDLWVEVELASNCPQSNLTERFSHACQLWQEQVQSNLENLGHRLAQVGEWFPQQVTTEFLKSVGLPITDAALAVTLQFMAPYLEVAPPMLGSYASSLQQSVYEQLLSFLQEMEQPLPESNQEAEQLLYEKLILSLQGDIRTFDRTEADNEQVAVFTLAKELSLNQGQDSVSSDCKISSTPVTQSTCTE